jgi:L-asparaginase
VRRHTASSEFDVEEVDALPRVDVVLSYVGADEVMIDAAVSHGAQGLVCAAYGAGHLSPAQERALDAASQSGVAVCIASRVGSGRVVRSPNLAKRGFVAAGNLLPWKARLLLSLALTRTKDTESIQAMFESY